MTSVSFQDMLATSVGARFSAEALSPENGTIPFPDFVPENHRRVNSFGFQKCFRYRLKDAAGRVVWERWQPEREPSPTNLYVSDDGHVVAGLHGYTAAPLVFFDGYGKIVFTVHVCTDWERIRQNPDFSRETAVVSKAALWKDAHISISTAGIHWQSNSLPCFFSDAGSPFFSIRSAWGRRLVVDLNELALLSDDKVASNRERFAALESAEAAVARGVIAAAAAALEAIPECERSSDNLRSIPNRELIAASVVVAGTHHLTDLVSMLRTLERISLTLYATGTSAFVDNKRSRAPWIRPEWLRPVVQQSLWKLGVKPERHSNYRFTKSLNSASEEELAVASKLHDLETRVAKLDSTLDPHEVLAQLGAPTFVEKFSVPVGRGIFAHGEIWEYDLMRDGIASTLCIRWSHERKGVIEKIEEIKPARWQTPAGRPYLCQ